jgi:diguanylate cyclase (GGDEF)-like protein
MNVQYTQVLQNMRLLEDSVNIDVKTGLLRYQDSYFENILKNLTRILISTGSSVQIEAYHLSYVRLDVDNFSKFNTRFGHAVGDAALLQLGKVIKETIRPTDLAIRYGGEEIDIILPATTASGAEIFLDKIFANVRKVAINTGEAHQEPLRVSGGVTSITLDNEILLALKPEDSLKILKTIQSKVDDALYEAKSLGKDRYCTYREGHQGEYQKFRDNYMGNKGK